MIDQLLNTTSIGMLERTLNFTAERNTLLQENIANIDTPGYVQKDVSTDEFEKSLADAREAIKPGYAGQLQPANTSTIAFDPGSNSVWLKPRSVVADTPFHDQGARSMESLMSNLADNAEVHSMAVSLLKACYGRISSAIQLHA